MRKIKTKDVFTMARIIKLSGAKDEFAETLRASQSSDAGDAGKIGVDLIMTLCSACGEEAIEKKLYELVGDIAEMKAEEIKIGRAHV